MENSNSEKNKNFFLKIFKITFVVWIANIISFIKIAIKPNEIVFFDIIIILGIVALVYTLIELVILLIKSNSQKKVKILKIVIVIFIVWSSIFLVDYFRVKDDKLPIFCFKIGGLQDGGTIYYIGIGYKVIDFHTYTTIKEGIIEKKYICPWSITYEAALEKVKGELNM